MLCKTIVIVSELCRDDFVPLAGHPILVVDEIKLEVLNQTVDGNRDYYLQHISLWSNLASLLRVIVILDNEAAASQLSSFLSGVKAASHARVSLQENLLLRSKSFDNFHTHKIQENNSLGTQDTLARFRNFHNGLGGDYEEPEPQPFRAYEDLQKLGIDLLELNSPEQLQELKEGGAGGPAGVKRSRSVTKTLFRPSVNTKARADDEHQPPASPTITLDETLE